jgi:hypothetical protein
MIHYLYFIKFFEGTSAGTAEAYTPIQLVRQIKNFIIYLIRYGLRRFSKFGTKINLLASYFEALDETDNREEIDLTSCIAYIQLNRKKDQEIYFQTTHKVQQPLTTFLLLLKLQTQPHMRTFKEKLTLQSKCKF